MNAITLEQLIALLQTYVGDSKVQEALIRDYLAGARRLRPDQKPIVHRDLTGLVS